LLVLILAAAYFAFDFRYDGTMLLFGGAFTFLLASLVLRHGWGAEVSGASCAGVCGQAQLLVLPDSCSRD
jgi:hypothetical protein